MRIHATVPAVTATDRLSMTLFFAVVVHAAVVLGIGFDFLKQKPRDAAQKMEITLVSRQNEKAPEKADYLAQANQAGSGISEEKQLPSASAELPSPAVKPKPGTAPQEKIATRQTVTKPAPQEKTLLTARQSEKKTPARDEKRPAPQQRQTAVDIINRSMEIASLDMEFRQRQKTYAARPRVKYINASTREYKYASYMEAWRAKVERIGRLHYPEEAKRRKLYGNLLLGVAINPDGSIRRIELKRSSGNTILDEAAMNIVRLAAPFAPLPENILEEIDVLHIERTWIFRSGNQLSSR